MEHDKERKDRARRVGESQEIETHSEEKRRGRQEREEREGKRHAK